MEQTTQFFSEGESPTLIKTAQGKIFEVKCHKDLRNV